MAVDYGITVVDHTGVQLNELPPRGLQLTRRVSAWCEAKLDVLATHSLSGLTNSNGVKVYRNGVLVFYGQINGRLRKKHLLTLNLADPFFFLSKRTRQSALAITAVPGAKGPAIVSQLLTAEQTRAEIHITMGASAAPSTLAGYTVNKGVQIDQAVNDLASIAGGYGFWFKINPVDGAGATFAHLDTALTSGTDRPGVRWEYGDGTLGNVTDDWAETEGMPVTNVGVWGQPPDGQGYKVGKNSGRATSGVGAYGLTDAEYQFDQPNPSPALLQAVAQGYLIASPPLTWAVKHVANNDTDPIWTPDPWADFDAGDTGRLTIADGNYSLVNQTVRVTEFVVDVDDDTRSEHVSSVTLEQPLAGTHTRVQPSPGPLWKTMLGLNRRLQQQEHNPQ